MPVVSLTDRFCQTVKPLGGTRTDYFDEVVSGLCLRVTPHGTKSWSCLFTSPRDGKRARITLGTYPATSLAAARGRALEARSAVEDGADPRMAPGGVGAAEMTVAGLVDAYLRDPEKAQRRSHAEVERRLRRNVVPVIGDVRLDKLRRRDVRTVCDPLIRRGVAVEAARVFEDVRGLIRWAVEVEYLDADPLAGMKRLGGGTARERILSDDEIAALWRGLPAALARSPQCQAIVRLCLVTAQRVGEVAGMARAEVDLVAREWRLPGERTKNGHAHLVPLSDMAVEIIRAALAAAGDKAAHVFPCGAGPLSPVAVARTILRGNETSDERPLGRFGIAPWTAHDLRRTALTGMGRLGVSPFIRGHVANHRTVTRATVTTAVYDRHDYGREKREALDMWADRVAAIIAGEGAAEVAPLRAGR